MSNPQPIRMPARSSTTAGFFKTASHRYGASMSISISSGVFASDLAEFVGFLLTGSMVKRVSASTPGRGRSSSVAGWDQAIERVQSRGLDLKEDREDGWLGINVPVRAPGTPKGIGIPYDFRRPAMDLSTVPPLCAGNPAGKENKRSCNGL
ncbi:hypothetical protein TEQG_00869 [Trichophyton equinum CBS 127.97]|uniref:Uncharacterized protein n=1 Tax=Trichophyton equinum (strain ATCC MYA-4606 / CBS 127.97) TaxID=559882 RepID=F2PIV8_TRIEC|nr:hypothetical protein TEQG_00869 [Trichophyton equinum CBS 127.97]